MKPKTMILMAVAVCCGLVASYLTSKVLAERGSGGGDKEQTVKVFAAKKNLALGVVIRDVDKYFVEKDVPVSAAPKKALTSLEQIKNAKLAKPLSEDAFLTQDDIMETGTDIFTQNIPPGYRAIAIKVTPDSMVGGFVVANTRVDVITLLRKDNNESYAQTILQNMLVLATDGDNNRPESGNSKIAATVTIAVKPDDAQKLKLAAGLGELSLSLRKYGDEDIQNNKPTRTKELTASTNANPNPDGTDEIDYKKPDIKIEPPVTEKTESKTEADAEAPVKVWVLEIRNGEQVTRVTRREDGKDKDPVVEKSEPSFSKPVRKRTAPVKPSDNSTDPTSGNVKEPVVEKSDASLPKPVR